MTGRPAFTEGAITAGEEARRMGDKSPKNVAKQKATKDSKKGKKGGEEKKK